MRDSSQARAASTTDALLTPAQFAERLGVTKRFVYRLTNEHRIRFVRVGKFIRIRESDLEAFIAAGVIEPSAPPGRHNGAPPTSPRRRQQPTRAQRATRTEPDRQWKLPRDNGVA